MVQAAAAAPGGGGRGGAAASRAHTHTRAGDSQTWQHGEAGI